MATIATRHGLALCVVTTLWQSMRQHTHKHGYNSNKTWLGIVCSDNIVAWLHPMRQHTHEDGYFADNLYNSPNWETLELLEFSKIVMNGHMVLK